MTIRAGSTIQKAGAILCVLLLPLAGLGQALPQTQQPLPVQQEGAPLMTPDQLDNLVAPIALYPDPLLGQVLAASTYPLEIAEAQQWLQNNGNLRGAQLMDAAKQQNWDPSVQALVAFPDVLAMLGKDLRWTTDLGNAFLAQQSDVMAAVQTMRGRAQSNGRLATTPQQVVTTETQNGQSAIQIQPADPQVIYVPVYQPAYVYGPPVWGAYPDLWYPPGYGIGFGFGFLPGIFASLFFPGWLGWGAWGWGLGWFGHGLGLFVNGLFFNHFGFHGGFGGGFGGRGFEGRAAWAHDPAHRMGVAYPNRAVASRFNSSRFVGSSRASAGGFTSARGLNGAGRSFAGQSGIANRAGAANRGAASANGGWHSFNGDNRAGANRSAGQAFRGGSSYGRSFAPSASASRGQNNFAARSYSAPKQSYSAPRSSGGSSRSFSSGHSSSAGHSGGGGHSSGHSGGGGHHK